MSVGDQPLPFSSRDVQTSKKADRTRIVFHQTIRRCDSISGANELCIAAPSCSTIQEHSEVRERDINRQRERSWRPHNQPTREYMQQYRPETGWMSVYSTSISQLEGLHIVGLYIEGLYIEGLYIVCT